MSRNKPTTTYTPRVKPNTEYSKRSPLQSDLWYLITQLWILNTNNWDRILFHTWNFSEAPTVYSRPRYSSYVEDITWTNVFDLSWELVQWISGNQVNKIDTVYT